MDGHLNSIYGSSNASTNGSAHSDIQHVNGANGSTHGLTSYPPPNGAGHVPGTVGSVNGVLASNQGVNGYAQVHTGHSNGVTNSVQAVNGYPHAATGQVNGADGSQVTANHPQGGADDTQPVIVPFQGVVVSEQEPSFNPQDSRDPARQATIVPLGQTQYVSPAPQVPNTRPQRPSRPGRTVPAGNSGLAQGSAPFNQVPTNIQQTNQMPQTTAPGRQSAGQTRGPASSANTRPTSAGGRNSGNQNSNPSGTRRAPLSAPTGPRVAPAQNRAPPNRPFRPPTGPAAQTHTGFRGHTTSSRPGRGIPHSQSYQHIPQTRSMESIPEVESPQLKAGGLSSLLLPQSHSLQTIHQGQVAYAFAQAQPMQVNPKVQAAQPVQHESAPQMVMQAQPVQMLPQSQSFTAIPQAGAYQFIPHSYSAHSVLQTQSFQPVEQYQAASPVPQLQTFYHPQGQYVQGIPHSYTVQNLQQQVLSPGGTAQHFKDGFVASPLVTRENVERVSEPRNCAPTTAGLSVVNAPPPKFALAVNHAPSQADVQSQDPFVSPRRIHAPRGLNSQAPEPSRALVPYQTADNPVATFNMGDLIEAVPGYNPIQPSEKLQSIRNTPTGRPSVEQAMNSANFPFVDGPRQAAPKNNGVIKLKNIPFSTSRSEIIAFLGRNSKILNDSEEPVHIIMDKATSKTMDAYVEFHTLADAMRSAERHHQNLLNGRTSRLGDRPIEVELSSQGSLMKDLFPHARGVLWDGPHPKLKRHNPREPWNNFKGFINVEEMTMLVKHVEVPHRSPFSKECPQRPYECLISTLCKFPWQMTAHITIVQRQAIYKATRELIIILKRAVERGDDVINVSPQLFKRVYSVALRCQGLSILMKDDLAFVAGVSREVAARDFGLPLYADRWTHQYALVPKPGMPLDVVEYYIGLVREQSERDLFQRNLNERTQIQEKAKYTQMH